MSVAGEESKIFTRNNAGLFFRYFSALKKGKTSWSVGCPKRTCFQFCNFFWTRAANNGVKVHHKKFQIYGPINKKPTALFNFTL